MGLIVSALIVICCAVLSACSQPFERPPEFDYQLLRDRAEASTENEVRVLAAIPSKNETQYIYGVDLYAKNVQPVWLEIENRTDKRLLFLPTGLDPEYFSPLEASFGVRKTFSKKSKAALDGHFQSLSLPKKVAPNSTTAGFVLTNLNDGAKLVSVDLISSDWASNHTMQVVSPDDRAGTDRAAEIDILLSGADAVDINLYEEAALRDALEQLPCCTTTKDGERAEPINLIVIGELNDIAPALARRNYIYTPIPSRFLFGRDQDLSVVKRSSWVPEQPHVSRSWVTPYRFNGLPVWAVQISSPEGGRFSGVSPGDDDFVIHNDVDEARNDIVQDLIYSQHVRRIGWLSGVGQVLPAEPRTMTNGSSYFTDGLRGVVEIGTGNLSLSELQFFDWERLQDHSRERISATSVEQ